MKLNTIKVNFHSDHAHRVRVQNDLWKRFFVVEVTTSGYVGPRIKLTAEKGSKALFSIDLKDSGKGHETHC